MGSHKAVVTRRGRVDHEHSLRAKALGAYRGSENRES
jgi:hypothetical protein